MPEGHEAGARGWRCVWTDCPLSAPARSPQGEDHEALAHLAKYGRRHSFTSCPPGSRAMCSYAEAAERALSRVSRDARGDEEAFMAQIQRTIENAERRMYDAMRERDEARAELAARSPQGEDSISPALKAATQALCRHENAGCLPNVIDAARDVVDAYLSRVSPSPERDTEKP